MKDGWAISGRDLHVEVVGSRVRASLEDSLRDALRSGRLLAGALVPPTRALAADLGIARNTVAEAYAQLVAEGWLTARQGSGTRVAATVPELEAAPVTVAASPTLPYDLRAGHPDVSSFPRSTWLAAARTAINAVPATELDYGDPRGTAVLREALAEYLARARGVRVTADGIVVCTGFTHGLWLVGSVLQAHGARTVGVESYGHRRHRDLIAHLGLGTTVLPVDDLGAVDTGLEKLDAVLLTPAHQFPLGMALDPARRAAFVRWANDSEGLIVEDDYDGEFRYDRRPVGAVQAMAPENVVYLGTASKTLVPGLRLAWMVLPARLVAPVTEIVALTTRHAPVLDQLTMAELLTSGGYDRHVRRNRQTYRQRRDTLVDVLSRQAPGIDIEGLPAGMHALLSLPPGTDEADVVREAARRGLALEGLTDYAAEPRHQHRPALVVGYATPPPHSYTGALARLTATLGGSDGAFGT